MGTVVNQYHTLSSGVANVISLYTTRLNPLTTDIFVNLPSLGSGRHGPKVDLDPDLTLTLQGLLHAWRLLRIFGLESKRKGEITKIV